MSRVIWVAGIPRSGSMWTFNVVRELVRRSGFRVLPEEVMISDKEWLAYANQEIVANRHPNTVFVLKTHSRLSGLPPDHLVITNVRDIRDVAMSYQRFMHCSFEDALNKCKIYVDTADHYQALPEARRLTIRYDELMASPADMVARIADRVTGGFGEDMALEIAAQFSREKVRELTESKDRRCQRWLETGQLPGDETLLTRQDGVYVTIDRSTGFQSNHVSDYRDGEWRQCLNAAQIGAMEDAFGGWLKQHGYAA